jgi:hypothetical protein
MDVSVSVDVVDREEFFDRFSATCAPLSVSCKDFIFGSLDAFFSPFLSV